MMKTTHLILFLNIIYKVCSLKVVVAGYNSKLAVYDVGDKSLGLSVEWDVGDAGKDMTWLQLDGDKIWAGHEGSCQKGQCSVMSFLNTNRWALKSSSTNRIKCL